MTRILGYGTTNAMDALDAFIANAEAQYTALEQAIAPIDEKIADLQKDWDPRPLAFWLEILEKQIPVIRKATTSCLDLFGKRSLWISFPLVRQVLSDTHQGDLFCVEEQIEEVGILLTAHRGTPESRSVEARIRRRQRLMNALQKLSLFVHEAIDKARLKLSSASEEQRRHKASECLYVVESEQGGRDHD